MTRSPIKKMIDESGLRCTVCNAPKGECDCWTPCHCGWVYRKGARCRNPIHGGNADGIRKVTHIVADE